VANPADDFPWGGTERSRRYYNVETVQRRQTGNAMSRSYFEYHLLMKLVDRPMTSPPARSQVLSHGAVKLLRRLLLVLLAIALFEFVYLIWTGRFELRNMAPCAILVVLGLSYRELAAERISRGLSILCWGVWASALGFSLIVAGVRTPFLYALPVVLMTTAWVQGRRAALLMATLTLIDLTALTIAEYQGWLLPPIQRRTVDLLITDCAVIAFAATIAVSLAEAFQRLYREEQELGEELRALNETLEQRVEERTEEYEQANRSLQETVDQLERTRAELVHSEKLSALGSMVAGVSHELNTPLGNAKLSVSTLRDRMQEISNSYRANALSRNQIVDFFVDGREVVNLANRAIERAIDLVDAFKQVAIDQTSERRRRFDLTTVIEETIATLRPGFKHDPWQISVDMPQGIEMDSYPGPLEQIVVNLVLNSIRHGFEGRDHGKISIGAHRESGVDSDSAQIVLTFADDGAGIAAENLGRVFDPFFTTRLGQGGSGIGLNITHRIATTILGGSITVESELGSGTVFTLAIPQRAPIPA
jgi:signal transduction histidine kinase